MTGYQEAVTDPCYAGQLITFTYPHDRQLRRQRARRWSPTASTRARRSCAPRRTARTPRRRGRLARLAARLRRAGASPTSTRARSCATSATRGAMRGGVFPASMDRGRGARADRGRAADERPRPGARGDAGASRSILGPLGASSAAGPTIAMIDTGVKARSSQPARARRDGRAAPLHLERRGAARARPRRVLPRQRPRRPGRARLHRRDGPRARRQEAGLRDLPRPPAAVPRGRPGDLQAAVRPPRRQPPGQGPHDRPRRDHQPEPRLRGARARRREDARRRDEPVRWETDFGAAELTHINLYDRTVEGLRCATCRARPSSTTPRPAPARTTRSTCSTASSTRSRPPPDAAARRHPQDPAHRLRADRDRPGGRVRLLGHAGVQGADGGGLRGRARQLQPGDDHDRPRGRDDDLRRAAAAGPGRRR